MFPNCPHGKLIVLVNLKYQCFATTGSLSKGLSDGKIIFLLFKWCFTRYKWHKSHYLFLENLSYKKKINRLYSSMELFFLSTVKLSSQVGRFQEIEYWKFEDGCKFCLARYNKLGGQFWVEGVLTPASIILLRNFWLALLTQITQRSARWMCEASTRARDNWDEIRRTHMVLVIRVVELWIASNRCLSAPRMNLLSNPKVDRYVTLIRSPTK